MFWILAAAEVAFVLFIVFYAWLSPWEKTWQGRIVLSQKVVLALLCGFFLLEEVTPIPHRDVWLSILVALIAVLAWGMFISLRVAQRTPRPVSKKRGTGLVAADELERTKEK